MLKFNHPGDKKMYEKAVEKKPYRLEDISDHFKTQEMCKEAFEKVSRMLEYVLDRLKTQTMCERTIEDEPETWNMFQIILRPK